MGREVEDVAEEREGRGPWGVVLGACGGAFGVEVVACGEDECEEERRHFRYCTARCYGERKRKEKEMSRECGDKERRLA